VTPTPLAAATIAAVMPPASTSAWPALSAADTASSRTEAAW
jgi:hypothetical protein